MAKIALKQVSCTQTARTVREELLKKYPCICPLLPVSNGVLAVLSHTKPYYRLGFVFEATDLITGNNEVFIYYPYKDEFMHLFSPVSYEPITYESAAAFTERPCTLFEQQVYDKLIRQENKIGNLQIVRIADEFAVSVSKLVEVVQ